MARRTRKTLNPPALDAPRYDPTSQEGIQARRERDAQRKQEAVKAREQQLAQAADPGGDTENVVVAKQTGRAARAEQDRIDTGKRAAERQQPQRPEPLPPTEGRLPQEFSPAHPRVPDPTGSAPHPNTVPAGPMDEDIRYETDDIEADGSPLIDREAQSFVEPSPEIDGESDRLYTDVDPAWQHSPAEQVGEAGDDGLEPVINQHSEEGARLDELKLQRPVVYVPNAATLDPKSGKGEV